MQELSSGVNLSLCSTKTETRVLHSRGSVCEVWADVTEAGDKATNTLHWRSAALLAALLFQLVHPSQVAARPQRDDKRRRMKRIRRVETDEVSSSISQLEYLIKVILRLLPPPPPRHTVLKAMTQSRR